MEHPDYNLSAWVDAETWRREKAASVFPTKASWDWFKRRRRRELVEAGALVLGAGRAPDLVHVARAGPLVERIRLEESAARLVDADVAGGGSKSGTT